jgi:hypothetical protein
MFQERIGMFTYPNHFFKYLTYNNLNIILTTSKLFVLPEQTPKLRFVPVVASRRNIFNYNNPVSKLLNNCQMPCHSLKSD